MSDSQSSRLYPDEPVWTRQLRRFRGRLEDDPRVSHLLAKIHTQAQTATTGSARALLLLSRSGAPVGQPEYSDSGAASLASTQRRGADLVLHAESGWSPEEMLAETESVVDEHIEYSQSVQYDWHVLYTRGRDDVAPDWCLVYARDETHALRKPSFPEAAQWGARENVKHLGSWPAFKHRTADGDRWDAACDEVLFDSEAPESPPEKLYEVLCDASE